MGDQNFNFALKLLQNGKLFAGNFVLLKVNFSTKKVSHRPKFRGVRGQWPQLPPPPRHPALVGF